MTIDLHLHTLVSDGELDPTAMLREAAAWGLTRVSLTDHDSLGAYQWKDGAVFGAAQRLGLELTVGIEMDAEMEGIEVHLLGYGVSWRAPALTAHLVRVREARFERARREIEIVNASLGAGTVQEEDVFVPDRQTLMKPHFIRPLVAKGHFGTYEEAAAWYRTNVKTGVTVPKPPIEEAIRLVKHAGGLAILAHPAYYEREGAAVATRLAGLKSIGLDGVELHYPYHACTPRQFTLAMERAYVESLRPTIKSLDLVATRGSDAHGPADLRRVYQGAHAEEAECRSSSGDHEGQP